MEKRRRPEDKLPRTEPKAGSAGWVSVKVASALLGVSAQTLRRWDESGVLRAERHPANNYRVYAEPQLRAWIAEHRALPPAPATTFEADREGTLVGRGALLATIEAEIARGARLLVLVGPGGVGKSRLARAWAARRSARVRTVAAGACRTMEDLAIAVGTATGATARAASAAALAEEVERSVAARAGDVLLVDEVENLDDEGTVFLGRLAATGVTVVATSRVRPHLASARVLPIPPLPYPGGDTPEEARESAAVSMLLERAQAAGALTIVDDEVLRHAAAIVRRLEGLPLALELAASRTPSIGIERLRRELDATIDAVGTAPLDAPAAHRTLRGTVFTSIERLDLASRALLERAAVLSGSFELDELEALAGDPSHVTASLHTLVDHSMVTARQSPAAAILTFSIHAVIREVVLESVSADRRRELDAAHAVWRARQAASLAEDRSTAGATRIARAEEGLLRAWTWAVAQPDHGTAAPMATDIARALGRLVETFGPSPALLEVLDRTDTLARLAGVTRGKRAEVAFYRGFVRIAQSELGEARTIYEEARQLATGGASPRFEAMTWCQLAWLDARGGDPEAALRALDLAREVMRGRAEPAPEMLVASLTAQLDLQRGKLAAARRGFDMARALAVRVGDRANEASACGFLGSVAYDEGAPLEALRHYDRAIAIASDEAASTFVEAVFRGYRAMTLHVLGDEAAEVAYLEAITTARRARSIRFESLFGGWRGVLLAQRGRIDDALYAIDAADSLPDVQARTVCALQRAHVDVARADEARRRGATGEAKRHEALACRALAAAPPDEPHVSREVRVARRSLTHAILSRTTDDLDVDVRVGWQAAWVELGAARIELESRSTLARLVWDLALRRILEPGGYGDVPALVAAVWPDERLRPGAAVHRLHVAVSTLRRLGLRDVLESCATGYRLAPTRTLELRRSPTATQSTPRRRK